MADLAVAVTNASRGGSALPAETDGHATDKRTFVNDDGQTLLLIRNSDASARDVVFDTPGTVDGLPIGDRTETIPAGETQLFGPFPVGQYGNPIKVLAVNTTTKLRAIHA